MLFRVEVQTSLWEIFQCVFKADLKLASICVSLVWPDVETSFIILDFSLKLNYYQNWVSSSTLSSPTSIEAQVMRVKNSFLKDSDTCCMATLYSTFTFLFFQPLINLCVVIVKVHRAAHGEGRVYNYGNIMWSGFTICRGSSLYKSLSKVTHPSQKPIYWDVFALELFSLLSSGQKYNQWFVSQFYTCTRMKLGPEVTSHNHNIITVLIMLHNPHDM